MPLRKALFPSACVLAAIASQSCVEYIPENNPPPPPPTQTYVAPQEQPPPPPQPPQQPVYYSAPSTDVPPPQPPPGPPPSPNPALDNLLAPIALYPDPLIALVLPASTAPGDISAAANYLIQYGDMSQLNNQPWDPSVRALAHYPTVVQWMAANMDWTQALGSAFSSDPNGVMDAVQRLRARARASGALTSGPQAQVMDEDGDIEIVPAQDNVIYVPVYDPEAVYSGNPYYGYGGPFINFGEPCPAGIWLSYSFDWRSHRVWAGDRENEGWRRNHNGGGGPPPGAHSWHPPTGARAPVPPAHYRSNNVPMPHPMRGAPRMPDRNARPLPNNSQQQPQQGAHNYPAPQDRPRLNQPPQSSATYQQRQPQAPANQPGVPARVVLPPTNHGESAPVQRNNSQAPVVDRSGQQPPARSGNYNPPVSTTREMPEHPAQPAREQRTQSAPARSAPPPSAPAPAPSNSSNQQNQKQN